MRRKNFKTKAKDKEPCSPYCMHHVSKPCDRCGRHQAKGEWNMHEIKLEGIRN